MIITIATTQTVYFQCDDYDGNPSKNTVILQKSPCFQPCHASQQSLFNYVVGQRSDVIRLRPLYGL